MGWATFWAIFFANTSGHPALASNEIRSGGVMHFGGLAQVQRKLDSLTRTWGRFQEATIP
jgi:hypothetical protein